MFLQFIRENYYFIVGARKREEGNAMYIKTLRLPRAALWGARRRRNGLQIRAIGSDTISSGDKNSRNGRQRHGQVLHGQTGGQWI